MKNQKTNKLTKLKYNHNKMSEVGRVPRTEICRELLFVGVLAACVNLHPEESDAIDVLNCSCPTESGDGEVSAG